MIKNPNPAASLEEARRTLNPLYVAPKPCKRAGHTPPVYYRKSRCCVVCAEDHRKARKPKPIGTGETKTVLRSMGWI